jgi:hypothetical protein
MTFGELGVRVMKSLVLGLAVAAVASLTSVAAYAGPGPSVHVATFNVSGTDDIFGAGLIGPLVSDVPSSDNNGGEGNAPSELNVTGGESFWVTAAGFVNCCQGNGSVSPTNAAGYATNPFGGGSISHITDSLVGGKIGSYTGPVFALTYAFLNASGNEVGGLHTLSYGTSGYINAPTGATQMYFGFADGFGFGGPSGAYGDNFNDRNAAGITLNISTAPEPATWALMILGVGFIGGALRLGHRQRSSMAIP